MRYGPFVVLFSFELFEEIDLRGMTGSFREDYKNDRLPRPLRSALGRATRTQSFEPVNSWCYQDNKLSLRLIGRKEARIKALQAFFRGQFLL